MCGDATTGPALRNACAIVSSRCGPPGPCKLATLYDESGRCCGTFRALSSDVLREYFHLIANKILVALDRMITKKEKQRHAVHATAVMPRKPNFNTRWRGMKPPAGFPHRPLLSVFSLGYIKSLRSRMGGSRTQRWRHRGLLVLLPVAPLNAVATVEVTRCPYQLRVVHPPDGQWFQH